MTQQLLYKNSYINPLQWHSNYYIVRHINVSRENSYMCACGCVYVWLCVLCEDILTLTLTLHND